MHTRLFLATGLVALFATTTLAQTTTDFVKIGDKLASERHALVAKKDAIGIGHQWTANGVFVLLQPTLDVKTGPSGVQEYYTNLFARNATNIDYHFTAGQALPDGTGMAWGEYDITAAGKTVTGHVWESYKQEGGVWKIAVHTIARPELPK